MLELTRLPPPPVFHRCLATSVSLDNRRLERQFTQLRHLQCHRAGLGLQLPLVMSGPRIDPVRASLVPAGATDLIRFGVQQTVERLLDAAPHCLVNMAAQLAGINSYRILQAFGCILLHGGGQRWFRFFGHGCKWISVRAI